MGRLILYVILVIADVFFCIFDIFKGYYLFSLVWALLAAYFVYQTAKAWKGRKTPEDDEKTSE